MSSHHDSCHAHEHTHSHEHGHGHHHHHHAAPSELNAIFIISIALNLVFVAVEAGVGFWSGSLGLLSDAGHNLSDVFSLLLALFAFKLSASRATERFTYGRRKGSVLIALLNAIILLAAVGAILVESIQKIMDASSIEVDGGAITWTAGAGIVVNGLTAWLLSRSQKHDTNTRGAFLHMLADTLVSVGVVVSGIVISLTGWTVIDPIIGIVIALVILVSTWSLLSESLRLSMDAVPEGIDPKAVEAAIRGVDGVEGVHHLHIWPISTTQTALTAHIELQSLESARTALPAVKARMQELGISHCTLEPETSDAPCTEHDCV